jgi:hypothetical protein
MWKALYCPSDPPIMMARGIMREQIGNHADPRDTSQPWSFTGM